MSEVIEALKWRYAVKKFDRNKTLSSEKITILKDAFNLTATSFGLQPVKLIIISDTAIKEQLPAISMNQTQVAEASHVLVFCIEKVIDSSYVKNYFSTVKAVRNTPDEILAPFKKYLLDHFNSASPETVREWAAKQAYLVMGNLLTVCALEAIDACPMEGFDPKAYAELLQLKKSSLEPVLVMPVGYRAEDDLLADLKKVRKELGEAVIELQ